MPPTSAGSGGGSGTVELAGVAEVCAGAADVALGVAEAIPDVVGAALVDVVGELLAEVLDLVDPEAGVAGDCGLWKSVQDSVRMVLPPEVMLSAWAVTV